MAVNQSYGDELFVHRADLVEAVPDDRPRGEFMIPLPLDRAHITPVPQTAGCYIIYLGTKPFYAGMSRVSLRRRLLAHATGRGSRMVRQQLADGHAMYFEYCDVQTQLGDGQADIGLAEACFLLLHTAGLLPGNLKADGVRRLGGSGTAA